MVFEQKDWSRGIQWYLLKHKIIDENHAWFKPTNVNGKDISLWARYWRLSGRFDLGEAGRTFDQQSFPFLLSLLWLTDKYRNVRELFESAPMLTWLTVVYAINKQLPEQLVDELCGKKRLIILKEIGIQARSEILSVLGKVQFSHIDNRLFQAIGWLLGIDKWKQLNRLPSIPFHMIKEASYPQAYDHPLLRYGVHQASWEFIRFKADKISKSRLCLSYLKRQASKDEFDELGMLFNDASRMEEQLYGESSKKVIRCKTIFELEALHDELVELKREKDLEESEEVVRLGIYPMPPLLGTSAIQAIDNRLSLMLESIEQHHCVSSYLDMISDGKYYVYKMDEPQRATIGLTIDSDCCISLDQVMLKYNRKPSDEVLQIINDWLSDEKHYL